MELFWKSPSWELTDPHLKGLKATPFQRKFPRTTPTEPGLYVIRGPRQIGKSSWLKTMLSEVCRRHESFYLSCENLVDHKDLAEVLKSVRGAKYIFLDEISFVKDWDRAVKYSLDSGAVDILICTGSHAVDIRRGMDQMPGRWGAGGDIELLPMEFLEFQAMRRQAGWPELSRVEELELYFRVGGFPTALIEAGPKGKDPKRAREIYKRWLLGDVTRLRKQEIYLREILGQIAVCMGSSISLQTLAQKTQIGSHHTAQEYISILEDCFAVKTLYCQDADTGSYRFRKEKKFYFRDPLLYWLALEWSSLKANKNPSEAMAEAVANESLQRKFPRMGYFQAKSGEIDFISGHDWAVEVKWATVVQNLSQEFKKFRSANKIVWSQSNFLNEWPPGLTASKE